MMNVAFTHGPYLDMFLELAQQLWSFFRKLVFLYQALHLFYDKGHDERNNFLWKLFPCQDDASTIEAPLNLLMKNENGPVFGRDLLSESE